MNILHKLAIVLIAGSPFALPCVAQVKPLDIKITLSKTTAMLGEPLWVDFTVTNTAAQPLAVSWGSDCCGDTELTVTVPEAMQGDVRPKPCGGIAAMACGCAVAGPSILAPGATETRRYVLSGDFRLTHPGHYTVKVRKEFQYAPASEKPLTFLPQDRKSQTATQELQLELTPTDPSKLLAIEQALANEANIRYQRLPMNVVANGDHEAYMAAVRAWSDAASKQSMLFMQHQYAIYQGLAAFPAPGMEPTFVDWETPPRSVGYGISALRQLNTPEARKALAHLAEPVPERIVNGVRQSNSRWSALSALADTGDRSYLPLIESYANDLDQQVRRSAIFGMGELGGEEALPVLDKIARETTNQTERTDAISTMGRTKSAKAIPLLIALFDIPNPGDPTAPNYALSTLTHHTPSNDIVLNTPERMKADWEIWWKAHSADAKIFGQYDCAEKFDQ